MVKIFMNYLPKIVKLENLNIKIKRGGDKMKIYTIRHGETDWNKLGKIQGVSDIELNEIGIEQAKEAAKKISEYNFDLILSSPLKRAAKTAEIVSDGNIPIIFKEELVERRFGKYEGCTTKEFDIAKCYDCKLNLNENGMEPVKDLLKRVENLLNEIKSTYKDRRVLLVTHGGTLRAINAYCNGMCDNIMGGTFTKNCEIKEFEY